MAVRSGQQFKAGLEDGREMTGEEQREENPLRPAASAGRRARILVAEDNPDMLRFLRYDLRCRERTTSRFGFLSFAVR